MADGVDKGAKEKVKESREQLDLADQQERLDVLRGKLDPTCKYKLITKEEYENLIAIKASTPLEAGKTFSFPSGSAINSFALQQGLNQTASNQSSFNSIPKLPTFSGNEEPQKGEVTYEVWSFEVRCLRNSQVVSDTVLLQLIRNSLKGNARSVLVPLGEQATVVQVLDKLEGFYGRVSSSETLLQELLVDRQRENESLVQFGSRLEAVLTQAVKYFHIDDAAKDGMLRSKFWTGIRSSSLRNATRYLFDSMKDFQSLFKEIRKIEQEIGQQTKTTVPKAAAQHNQAAAKVDKPALDQQELLDALRNIEKRLERVEKQRNQGNVNNNQSSDRDRSQRGNSRGGRRWFQNRGNNSRDSNRTGNPKEDSLLS